MRENLDVNIEQEVFLKADDENDARGKMKDACAPRTEEWDFEKVCDGIFSAIREEGCAPLTSGLISQLQEEDILVTCSQYSAGRSVEIYNRYTKIENNTRVLLYIALSLMSKEQYTDIFKGLVGDFYSIKSRSNYSADTSKAAVVISLTLGELKRFLEFDYNSSSRCEKISETVEKTLSGSVDFEAFKTNFKAAVAPKYVWEEMQKLLKNHLSVGEVRKCYKDIFDIRNKVAHSQFIDKNEYDKFTLAYEKISPIISRSNYADLDNTKRQELTKTFSDIFRKMVDATKLPVISIDNPNKAILDAISSL